MMEIIEIVLTERQKSSRLEVSGARVFFSVAYRYRKSISIIELFVSIYIGFLATNF